MLVAKIFLYFCASASVDPIEKVRVRTTNCLISKFFFNSSKLTAIISSGIDTGGGGMTISYNKLWKLLIDKKMKKKDLQKASGISSSSVAKLGRNENVNTEILQKICSALHCDVCDIMEMEDETNTKTAT
jgi:DNA-binding Xre family transcriptional regulator